MPVPCYNFSLFKLFKSSLQGERAVQDAAQYMLTVRAEYLSLFMCHYPWMTEQIQKEHDEYRR